MKGRSILLVAVAGFTVARVAMRIRARRKSALGSPAQVASATLRPEAERLAHTLAPQSAPTAPVTVSVRSDSPTTARRTTVHPRHLPEGSHLAQVHFGSGGARKDRRRRAMGRLAIVALIASVFGLPGVNLGFELLGERLGRGEDRLTRAELGGVTTSESVQGLMRMRGDLFQSRPTPTPTPTPEAPEPAAAVAEAPEPEAAVAEPAPAPAGSVTEILYAAAAEFGLDGGYLVSVASCESGLNPGAVNPAGYHGLFQFAESTWASYGYGSIYDATAQARTAARMLAAGMAGHWPNCA